MRGRRDDCLIACGSAILGIFERAGVEIARSTQSLWCRDVAELVTPLYELLTARVLASRVVGIRRRCGAHAVPGSRQGDEGLEPVRHDRAPPADWPADNVLNLAHFDKEGSPAGRW
jgi:hypothetical protein